MPGRVLRNIDIFFHMTCQKKSNDTWILSVDYRGLILVFSETPKSGETVQWPSIPIWGRKMDVVQNHLFFSGWTQKNHQTYITKNLYPEFIFILFSNWEVAKLKIKMIANGASVTQDFHTLCFQFCPLEMMQIHTGCICLAFLHSVHWSKDDTFKPLQMGSLSSPSKDLWILWLTQLKICQKGTNLQLLKFNILISQGVVCSFWKMTQEHKKLEQSLWSPKGGY